MTAYYEYLDPPLEKHIEKAVFRVLSRLGFNEQPGVTSDPYCAVCHQPLEPNLDPYGQANGYRPHQPGYCIHRLSERILTLERRLAGL